MRLIPAAVRLQGLALVVRRAAAEEPGSQVFPMGLVQLPVDTGKSNSLHFQNTQNGMILKRSMNKEEK